MTIAQQLKAEGNAEGRIEKLREIIKRLIDERSSPEFISKITGLSLKETLKEMDVSQDKH